MQGDMRDADALEVAIRDFRPTNIFHLAGLTKAGSSREFFDVNCNGTENLFLAARKLADPPVTLLASSLAAVGPSSRDVKRTESDKAHPVSHYGRSKLRGEQLAMKHASEVPTTVVRPPIVIGPGDRDGLEMFRSVWRWKLHLVPTRSEMLVSWIHVKELVAAMMTLAHQGERLQPGAHGQGTYFSTSDEVVEYGELGQKIGVAVGRTPVRIVRTPPRAVWLLALINEGLSRLRRRRHVFGLDKAREATAGSWTCDGGKLSRRTGFRCQMSLVESLESTTDWYREHHWI
jgi:nucleoside-diphosphate-sugar epimerase